MMTMVGGSAKKNVKKQQQIPYKRVNDPPHALQDGVLRHASSIHLILILLFTILQPSTHIFVRFFQRDRMGGTTTFSVGSDAVAIITINNPPVNLLNSAVLKSLRENFDQALQRDDVKAIVVTGAKGKYSGGYDMNALVELQEGKDGLQLVHILSHIMETARKPSVAAINGPALGAGLEVAMACNARIATSTAQLSLPELKFGIIPGGGGTQRLPRLVGLPKALEMMLASKPVHGEEAHKFGLVDAIVSEDELLENARQMALDILASGKPLVSSLKKTDKIEPLGKAREILNQARGQTPSLQHSKVCLDCIEEGIVSGPDAGLSKEREKFQILLKSDTCKSRVNEFIALGSARKHMKTG